MGYRLLVVESENGAAEPSVCAALADDSAYKCQPVSWERLVRQSSNYGNAHAVVAVAPQTPETISLFEWLRENPMRAPTLAVLPNQIGEPLLRIAAAAADDFIVSPVRADELRHRLGRLIGSARHNIEGVRERLLDEMGLAQLVGTDPAFVGAIENVPRFARSNMPVLITGETGTGKELCARAIHFLSKRRDSPFIAVDCSALPDHLVENELFGHTRGAYTDAHRDQRGLVAMAEGGTVFLDEVDSLSLTAQAKLLRFLQERTFRPLGSDRFVHADVNVIAATNRDIDACVRDRLFRSDLYFRLNVLRLHLPPLRDRRGDIALLAHRFLETHCVAAANIRHVLTSAALYKMRQYDWPGNVRELLNVLQRAAVLAEGTQISANCIELPGAAPAVMLSPTSFRVARSEAIAAFERAYVTQLLHQHHGNVTRAARDARKDRRAFGRLVKKYAIDRRSA